MSRSDALIGNQDTVALHRGNNNWFAAAVPVARGSESR